MPTDSDRDRADAVTRLSKECVTAIDSAVFLSLRQPLIRLEFAERVASFEDAFVSAHRTIAREVIPFQCALPEG